MTRPDVLRAALAVYAAPSAWVALTADDGRRLWVWQGDSPIPWERAKEALRMDSVRPEGEWR